MPHLPHQLNNRLLKMLETTDEKNLISHMQLMYLPKGKTLFESGQKLAYAYFPTSAVICMLVEPLEMMAIESASIGNEGVLGAPLLKDDYLTTRAKVQTEGYCYRIEVDLLQQSINRSQALTEILLKYLRLRMAKVAQMAICSRQHPIEQQLCSVLLTMLDSSTNSKMAISPQTISTKLNVLPESIAYHIDKQLRAGVIDLRRGNVIVLNRSFVESKACECYQIMVKETADM